MMKFLIFFFFIRIIFLFSFSRVRPGTIYREQDKYGIFGFKYGVLKSGTVKVGDPIYKITY